jgi:hypothetical protein
MMSRIRRIWPAPTALALVTLAACSGLTDALSPTKSTYKSVWINASWSGGRTGTPLASTADSPVDYVGSLCPANALLLENHTTRYAAFPNGDILIVTNNCTIPIEYVAICRTAGSGGSASSIPVCATDPRQTPVSNFNVHRLGRGSPDPWGTTSLNLDINVFYCAQSSHLNFGEISGKPPTDCVAD